MVGVTMMPFSAMAAAELDSQITPVAEVTHGSGPGVEHLVGMPGHGEEQGLIIEGVQRGEGIRRTVEDQMDVGVDQTGQRIPVSHLSALPCQNGRSTAITVTPSGKARRDGHARHAAPFPACTG